MSGPLESPVVREMRSMVWRHRNRLQTAVALGMISEDEANERMRVAFLPRETE